MRFAVASAFALAAIAPSSADAVSAPPVALTVSPARAVLRTPTSRTLELSNLGLDSVAVAVGWKSLGQPIGPSRWFTIAPRRLVPIHSFKWDEQLDAFENVQRLSDGEPFTIP